MVPRDFYGGVDRNLRSSWANRYCSNFKELIGENVASNGYTLDFKYFNRGKGDAKWISRWQKEASFSVIVGGGYPSIWNDPVLRLDFPDGYVTEGLTVQKILTVDMDTDEDGVYDFIDTDDDDDGILDVDDAFPLDASESVDTDGDGIGNNTDTDDDGDGAADDVDPFP